MTAPVLAVYWDRWSPKVLSSILMDAIQWTSMGVGGRNAVVYVYSAPDTLSVGEGASDLLKALTAAGIKVSDSQDTAPTVWKGYYHESLSDLPILPSEPFYRAGRKYTKCLIPKKATIIMRPNDPRYPVLRETYVPAPPSSNPLTRPRPPRNADTTFLPPWAKL